MAKRIRGSETDLQPQQGSKRGRFRSFLNHVDFTMSDSLVAGSDKQDVER